MKRTGGGAAKVGIVAVNFNTQRLISQLVFSLYRVLGRSEFATLVVVDNGSTDGSVELLESLAAAGMLHLIRNPTQQYHGPALTQGVSWLASRQSSAEPGEQLDYVWLLDSDVVVLRPDTVRTALGVFEQEDAAAVGQRLDNPVLSRVLRHNQTMLSPFSLMLDPARIWRPPIPPFVEEGAPATALQVAADAEGLHLAPFPFVDDAYLIHLGRGTLQQVAATGDTQNRYYGWATDHQDAYFMGQADAPERYQRFCSIFQAEVGELTPDRLAKACETSRELAVE